MKTKRGGRRNKEADIGCRRDTGKQKDGGDGASRAWRIGLDGADDDRCLHPKVILLSFLGLKNQK